MNSNELNDQNNTKMPVSARNQRHGERSAHAREQKMAENLNSTFVNKNLVFKNLR